MISTIPSAIKEIMTAAGYNSAMSIIKIDEQKLDFIEQYVQQNCRNVVDMFKEYSNIKPFKFLPGHRECIFGIKEEILKMQNRKASKTTKTSHHTIDIDEAGLQSSLENQVSNFAISIGLTNVEWGTAINNFNVTKSGSSVYATCSVACPRCKASINVLYDKHWKISNIFRHLRRHSGSVSNHVEPKQGGVYEITKLNTQGQAKKNDENEESHYETIYVELLTTNEGQNENVGDMTNNHENV